MLTSGAIAAASPVTSEAVAAVKAAVAAEEAEGSHSDMSQEELDKEMAKIHEEIATLRTEHDEVFMKGDKDSNKLLSPEEFYAVQKEDEPEADQVCV